MHLPVATASFFSQAHNPPPPLTPPPPTSHQHLFCLLMHGTHFAGLCTSQYVASPSQQRLFTRVGARSEVDFESYGEKALMEVKEEREVNSKLKEIEDRLSVFQNTEITQVLTIFHNTDIIQVLAVF